MAEKLNMTSDDIIEENIDYIASRFPNALKEIKDDNGKLVKRIDFDILKQELSNVVIDDKKERYQMTWPDKKKSILLANSKINGTLRPVKEKSVDFDNTQNLYIEGDNLDVLKLLRETYLGKIKMIYIDPPYNTGSDFVYEDDFAQSSEEYLSKSGQYDEQGNRLVANSESNGRFHTDWLNMMYPRLKVARDLLTDDGVIFISIDDNEVENLKKICAEIYGDGNFVGEVIRKTKSMTGDKNCGFNLQHENLVIYSKNIANVILKGSTKKFDAYTNPDNDKNGDWCSGDPSAKSGGPSTYFEIVNPFTNKIDLPPKGRYWAFSKSTLNEYLKSGKVGFKKQHKPDERGFIFKRYKKDASSLFNPLNSLFIDNIYMNQNATTELANLMGGTYFSYPKPVEYLYDLIKSATSDKDIVMDFFSGSSTTAHAVMSLNGKDRGKRRFIMVQISEDCDSKSVPGKAGYTNICDIGEERIRRAGKKIKDELIEKKNNAGLLSDGVMDPESLDIGFRVLKLDSSNMNDVYYNPSAMTQSLLEDTVDNIKPDRTPLDLLFQVMLELGIELSAKIIEKEINGKKYYQVNDNDIVACFDDNLDNNILTEIAKLQPLYAVFKDSSFSTDSVGINNEQIFKTYSPGTKIKVL